MPARTPAQERAARLRAARDYAGVTFAELAERAGVPLPALKKAAAHRGPRVGTLGAEAMQRVGDAAGVPGWFMEFGWNGAFAAEPLIEAWMDGRDVAAEVKDLLVAQLRRRVDDRHPELSDYLDVLTAMDSLDPRESAAMRELLRRLASEPPSTTAMRHVEMVRRQLTGKHVDRATKAGKSTDRASSTSDTPAASQDRETARR